MVATIGRSFLQNIVSFLGSFTEETYNFKEPTKCSHPKRRDLWVWNHTLWQFLLKIHLPRKVPKRQTQNLRQTQKVSRSWNSKGDFGFNLNLYRGVWVSEFGGFRGCSIFSGKCHRRYHFDMCEREREHICGARQTCGKCHRRYHFDKMLHPRNPPNYVNLKISGV